jgi:phenylalanyl-tRNA synthetase beta chain
VKVTYGWLGDWVVLPPTPEELAHLLATRGLPVESLERGTSFDPAIVVGRVIEVARHPNADRLSLCSVDIGTAKLSIVCGAPNVAAGQKVAVAQVGSRLPDGTKLRKTKIRGVESEGMICSERELGLSDESEGIWVLSGEPRIGEALASALGGSDAILDVEITSNRADCMSVLGLAREIGSALDTPIKPRRSLRADSAGDLPEVSIEDPADCPRYMARVVRGVRIGPSPDWLRRRLETVGFRSINNVVDATNYTLREMGQPIHAFDASKVGGNAIRVRRAKRGERLTLLDGRDVALGPAHLVIADRTHPMALAGVMGGLESGVSDSTREVVLESAHFDAALTEATARSLEIESDAAARFSQGIDPEGVALALDSTARLLAEIAGGSVVRERVDLWPGRKERPTVRLSYGNLTRLLGMEIGPDRATQALAGLGIEAATPWTRSNGDQTASFRPPSYRGDLEIEVDLIEEVGRAVGYDSIPTRIRAVPEPTPRDRTRGSFLRKVVDTIASLGFHEAMTNVLVGAIPPEARGGLSDEEIWELQNPKSRELKHLRTGLLPGLLTAAARNVDRGLGDVRLAEVGKVFRALPPPIGTERYEAALVLTGLPDEWDRPGTEQDRYLELKGAIEALLEALGIDSVRTGTYHDLHWNEGTGAAIRISDRLLGHLGEVSSGLAAYAGLTRPAWAAILDVEALGSVAPWGRRYREIPRYPAIKRDLAVIVPRETHHAEIEEVIGRAGGPLLTGARLFDVFEGAAIGTGRKSMAYALEFRAPDRTLVDREVEPQVQAIVRELETRFGAALRGELGSTPANRE